MENNYWKNAMKEQTDALNKGINNYQNEISNMDSLSKNVNYDDVSKLNASRK